MMFQIMLPLAILLAGIGARLLGWGFGVFLGACSVLQSGVYVAFWLYSRYKAKGGCQMKTMLFLSYGTREEAPCSGSAVRPLCMEKAFQSLGYRVISLWANRVPRREPGTGNGLAGFKKRKPAFLLCRRPLRPGAELLGIPVTAPHGGGKTGAPWLVLPGRRLFLPRNLAGAFAMGTKQTAPCAGGDYG